MARMGRIRIRRDLHAVGRDGARAILDHDSLRRVERREFEISAWRGHQGIGKTSPQPGWLATALAGWNATMNGMTCILHRRHRIREPIDRNLDCDQRKRIGLRTICEREMSFLRRL